jgi:hypothetical protein
VRSSQGVGRIQLGAIFRRDGDYGLLDYPGPPSQIERRPLNSVGAEVGKPVAPQTASVGVSTNRFVRNEGAVIRHNMAWTLILLIYLILIGVFFYLFFPRVAMFR